MSSEPRVALITGASKRVGAATARALHANGWRIAIHYRHSSHDAQALADLFNAERAHSATTFGADLNDLAQLAPLVDAAAGYWGQLDALVNNASTFYATPIGQIDATAWDDLMASNLQAPLFLAQAAAPHLQRQQGCIINITDIHAERPLPGFPVYSAAKGGLLNLTRALAIELGPAIRVNAVAPGAIQWPDDDSFPPAEQARIIEQTLLKRVGNPTDIARTVRFLIEDAPYITGQVINVDGGRSCVL